MINRWMKGSAVAVFALGMFACSSPSVGLPSSSSGDDVTPPATETPSTPSTPKDPAKDGPKVQGTNPIGSGETKSVAVDNAVGATIELSDGTKIEIPAGALPSDNLVISVTSSTQPAPGEYSAISPLFVFGPDGTVFSAPVHVSFPVTVPVNKAPADLTVLWSRLNAVGYDIVPTTFSGIADGKYLATAEVTHFSTGFCGEKYSTDPHPNQDPYQE